VAPPQIRVDAEKWKKLPWKGAYTEPDTRQFCQSDEMVEWVLE